MNQNSTSRIRNLKPLPRGMLIAGVIASAIAPAIVVADTAPGSARVQGIEEVIITARKREETLTSAPVSVYALDKRDIQKYAIADLISASKLTPSLLLSRATDNQGANIYMRGVGTSFASVSFEQAVSINIDNIPINKGRAIYQGMMDMERIEVMRGPQALFYGKNSTAGVVAVHTANPGDEPERRVQGGYEFNARQYFGELVWSQPLSDDLGIRLALRGSNTRGGFFDNIGQSLNGVPFDGDTPDEEQYTGRLTIAYRPSDAFDINLKVAATDVVNNGINAYTQLTQCQGPGGTPQPVFGVPNPADGCRIDKTTSQVALDPAIAADFPHANNGRPHLDYRDVFSAINASYHWDAVTLTSVTGYYDYTTESFANFDMGGASQIFGREHVEFSSFTQELRLTTDLPGRVNFTGGLFFDDTDTRFNRAVRLFTAPPDPATGRTDQWDSGGDTTGTTYSAFVEVAYEIAPSLEVFGGARYTREEKDTTLNAFFASQSTGLPFIEAPIDDSFDDDNISPEITLRWRPGDDTTLYLSYKEGYKSGGSNLSEIPFLGTNADTIGFESEEAEGYEAGIKGYLLDRAFFYGLTFYRSTFENLQVSVFDSAQTTLHVGNAGKYRTQGVELDVNYLPSALPDLSLKGSVYYNDAEYLDFVGACYAGQTIAAGCNLLRNDLSGAFTSQNYKGRAGAHAPEWTYILGADYETEISRAGLTLGLSTDLRYTSSYFLGETLSPFQKQEGYTYWNAALRLSDPARGWELALVGKNLTDKLVGAVAIDHPGTGFGTGTGSGLPADTSMVVGNPREITLQATYSF